MKPEDMANGIRARLQSSTRDPDAGPAEIPVPPRIPDHELLRRIGGGSYGDVWIARSATGSHHAVKVVWRRNFSSDRPYEREFRGIVQFEPLSRSHPGVVNVLHVGRNDAEGFFFYVMELADPVGGHSRTPAHGPGSALAAAAPLRTGISDVEDYAPRTLAADLKDRGRLGVTEVLELGVQLANALGHVHRNGLVHRDVKPSNVIFVNGQAKLADIGLVAGRDEARSFVGTEGFIPPEGPGTPRADLFGLGRLLYEAATGQDRCDFPEMPVDLDRWPDRATTLELNEVLMKVCAPEAFRRHANAAELAGDLNLILSGRSIRRTYGIERRLRRATQITAVAAVALVVATGAVWFQRQQREQFETQSREQAALRQRAEQAERQSREQLRESLLQQARALTSANELDRRQRALAALRQAAQIRPGVDLRNAAIAALARPELRSIRQWDSRPDGVEYDRPDPQLHRYCQRHADGTISVHTMNEDTELVRLPTPGVSADFGVFSPDSEKLAVKYSNRELRLWDLTTRSNVVVIRNVEGFGFSPDGRWMIACSGGYLHHIDPSTGRTLFRRPGGTLADDRIGFHPVDPLFLARGERPGALEVRHLDTGAVEQVLQVPELGMVAEWSGDGRNLVTSHTDFSVRVWDWPHREVPRLILRIHDAEPTSVATDPAGRWLATVGWDAQLAVFDLHDGRLIFRTAGNFVFPSNRRTEFLFVNGRTRSLVAFEDGFAFEAVKIHESYKSPRCVVFSPDGRWVASSGSDGIRVVDLRTRETHRLADKEETMQVRFNQDSSRLHALTLNRVRAWQLSPSASEFRAAEIDLGQDGRRGFRNSDVASISPDGERWLSVGTSPKSQSWSWVSGRFDRPDYEYLDGVTANSVSPEFSPDGRWLAWGNWHGRNAHVMALGTNSPPVELRLEGSATTAFSPDNRMLVAGGLNRVDFYETGTWRLLRTLPRSPSNEMLPFFAFTSDSRLCAVVCPPEHIVLIDPATGAEHAILPADRHILSRCAFSPDDRTLAIASTDHHVLFWDLAKLRHKLDELGIDWRDKDAELEAVMAP